MSHIHIWAVLPSSSNPALSSLEKIIHQGKYPVFLWNAWPFSWSMPSHCHCLSTLRQKHLSSLREDFLKFTYDLAFISHKGKPLHAHLKGQDGISFYWYSLLFEKHPRLWPQLYEIFTLRALELSLQKNVQVKKIILHGKVQPLYEILQAYCTNNGLELQCKKYACAKPKRAFAVLRKLKNMRKEQFLNYIPHGCKAVLRFLHWCFSVKRFLPCTVFAPPKGESAGVRLVTYAPPLARSFAQATQGYFAAPYWQGLQEYVRQYARQQKVPLHWLCIRMRKKDMPLRKALDTREILQKKAQAENLSEYFYFAEEFLDCKDIMQVLGQFVRMAFCGFSLESTLKKHCHMQPLGFNYWPLTKKVWRESTQGWRGLERLLQQKALQNYVQAVGKQQWTLFPQENCPWERMLISAVKKAQAGPIYGAQHSCVRPTDFRYFEDARFYTLEEVQSLLPDAFFVNGAMAFTQYIDAHMPQELVHAAEALRYEYILHLQKELSAMPKPHTYKHLYVLTSFFPTETQNQFALLADFLHQEKKADHWQIYVKPHPYLLLETFLQDHALTDGVQVLHGTMQTFLQHMIDNMRQGEGAVLWCANSTTTALEAACLGLPFCVQGVQDAFDLCPLQGQEGLCVVNTLADLQVFLKNPKALHMPKDVFYLDSMLSRWKEFLKI